MNQQPQNKKSSILVDLGFNILTLPFRFLFGAKITVLMAKFKLVVVAVSLILIVLVLVLIAQNNSQYESEAARRNTDSSFTGGSTLRPELIGKVLNVPYFNQYLETDGSNYPAGGWKMCGAASSVMIAGYYGKIPFSSESDLKRYMYEDKGQGLSRYCSDYGGAFGVTSNGTGCSYNTSQGMTEYLGWYNLGVEYIPVRFDSIKNAIDQDRPIILSTSSPYGHLAVIKGYTNDGRLIMNDPFKNAQDGVVNFNYSTNGKDAIYSLDYPTLNVTGLLSVYKIN
jgi:hypothetical protein